VLNVVKKVLGEVEAGFTCGCLFVECTVEEGVKLETALLAEQQFGGIVLNRIGKETAYDFV
jgi:hypothetical protein